MPQRVKNKQQKHTARPNKPTGNDKHVNSKQAMHRLTWECKTHKTQAPPTCTQPI